MRHDIIPTLRYADAPRAIEFLCTAFGFERHAVHLDDADPSVVQHAQLTIDDRMIMVSTALDTEAAGAAQMKTVAQAGGPTMGLYLTVADIAAHAERARAAGATIILGPDAKDYGGEGYSALDPEGNVWAFGSYDPWA
jgi:uncharacterized glyoxalase superfamily protein PhnB